MGKPITSDDGYQWVSTGKAAELTGVTVETVRRWCRANIVESLIRDVTSPGKRPSKRILVRLDQVKQLIVRDMPAVSKGAADTKALADFDSRNKRKRKD